MANNNILPLRRSFAEIVTTWAEQSAVQLRDTFKMQKIYVDGGSPAYYEVWNSRRSRSFYTYDRPYARGQHRKRKKKRVSGSWGWYDENRLRIMKKQQNPNIDYWFSTGESYKQIGVTTHNISEDPDEFIVTGEVRFATTMHLMFAEAGVGKTGKHHKRMARGGDITVQRDVPFRHNERYAAWKPMQGDTHRPNTRQQVWYMARRLRWLGNKYFNYKVNTWITMSLREMLDTKDKSIMLGGLPVAISPEEQK